MQFDRLSEQQAYDRLTALNARFWSRTLDVPGIYGLLKVHGYDYRECVLAELCPDSGGTYAGTIVAPGRRMFEFDVDPDDFASSIFEPMPTPDEGRRPGGAQARSGRWLAWRYFDELISNAVRNE